MAVSRRVSLDDLAFQSVADLAKLLRRRKASSLEITRYFLDRLARYGSQLNAVAEIARERAEAEARVADQKLSSGEQSRLLGIPYGVKDVIATRGVPTRWGAAPYRDQVFDYDSTVIERLHAAGGVLTAKLALIELCGAGIYDSPAASLHGPGLNPWRFDRWAGGSSSGSAAAVAAGLVPFALGSETWGSITIPASYCGVTGFRPSYGAVSRHGVMAVAWSMDKVGPLARTAFDCATVLCAIAGQDDRDPSTNNWKYHRARLHKVRVGVLPIDFSDSPSTERAFHSAVAVLESLGLDVRRAELPRSDYAPLALTIFNGEVAAAHEELIRSPRIEELADPGHRMRLRLALGQPVATYARALEERVKATKEIRALFQQLDILVAPTVVGEALPIDCKLVPDGTDVREAVAVTNSGYSVLGAIAGVPAVSLPMGFGASGLPLGLSLIGDIGQDAKVLSVGAAFQRETDWHLQTPGPFRLNG